MRRKQVPWLHQYSRLLIGSIAILGILNTAYLTWVKLSNNGVCGTVGCDTVLTSPYANVGDLPLTGLGLVSYVVVALLAFAPMLVNPKTNKSGYNKLNDLTWMGLLLAGVGMAVFSGYLMFLLAFVIKAACPFCIASAIFTFAIFGLTLFGREWDDIGQILFAGMAAALLSLVVSLALYNTATPNRISVESGVTTDKITTLWPPSPTPPTPGLSWAITSASGAAEIGLAEYLTQKGAKMYGSYACSHCYTQKQLFGKQAWEKINYVECAPTALKNPQTAACTSAGITGYPTWSIDGKLDPGAKTLAKLAKMSGYTGDMAFKYDKLYGK
jgi:uncharacterized membrane protein